jgi:hypothetical protein
VIVSFYSFKGGVGRSMALANIAALFSRAGFRVVVVDGDLEAPGVEEYLAIDSTAVRSLHDRFGLIDLIEDYRARLASPPAISSDDPFPDLTVYLSTPDGKPAGPELTRPGMIALLTAGRRSDSDDRYAERVNNFDWNEFKADWAGDSFFEWLRGELNALADIVFVDTRTGVTELGGVWTHLVADLVVALCSPNDQNLRGTRAVVDSLLREELRSYRIDSNGEKRELEVLVVPARVDLLTEPRQTADFARRFDADFSDTIPRGLAGRLDKPTELMIPYIPSHAFREGLAVPLPCRDRQMAPAAYRVAAPREDPPPDLLTKAYYRLADAILGLALEPKSCKRYSFGRIPLLYVDEAPEDLRWAERLRTALEDAGEGPVTIGPDDPIYWKSNEQVSTSLRLRTLLDPFHKGLWPVVIQLDDPVRDAPVRRWGPVCEVFRTIPGLQDPFRCHIRVELGYPKEDGGHPSSVRPLASRHDEVGNRSLRAIRWSEWWDTEGVVKAISAILQRGATEKLQHEEFAQFEVANLSLDALKSELNHTVSKLAHSLYGSALKWWKTFVKTNTDSPHELAALLRRLKAQNANVEELYLSRMAAGTGGISLAFANLEQLAAMRGGRR